MAHAIAERAAFSSLGVHADAVQESHVYVRVGQRHDRNPSAAEQVINPMGT